MDPASVSLIIGAIAQGVGVAREIQALARRVEAGDTITDFEISEARVLIDSRIERWDNAADKDKPDDE